MKKTKYTPGPWIVRSTISHPDDYTQEDGTFVIDCDEDGWAGAWSIFEESEQEDVCPICSNKEIASTLGEGLANADLISSAPDLLEACKEALYSLNVYCSKYDPPDCKSNTLNVLKKAIAKAEGREVG